MMNYSDKFLSAVNFVLENEGGLVNDELDPGGVTNFGVSYKFYKSEVKPDGVPDDIINLTKNDAVKIYNRYFWKQEFELFENLHLLDRFFDSVVLIGNNNSVKMLQKTILVFEPQILDIDSSNYVNGVLTQQNINTLNDVSIFHYDTAVFTACRADYFYYMENSPRKEKFINGWLRRVYR